MPYATFNILLAFALCSCTCFAQINCEAQKSEEMTGRDDSVSDRKPFMSGEPPEDQMLLLSSNLPFVNWTIRHRICSFGWLDGGFTSIGSASGLVAEAPTPDRFSDQIMLDAAWLTVERRTTDEGFSWGFRADFYAGSDAALLRPLNFFGPQGPRWGTDFRQAYLLLHTPIVFARGIDWTIGRINLPTGAETGLAPYQQLYSRGYFWIHDETGGTAALATLHATRALDVVLGTVAGYGTFFELRGRAPSYIGRFLYRPAGRTKQQFIGTVYSGPLPLATERGHLGNWQTLSEVQFRQAWSARVTQILQAHYSANPGDPGNGHHTSSTRGAFVITALRLDRTASVHTRLEWFADPHGVRTAVPGNYGEATVGLTLAPKPWLEVRPEVRGDFAGQASFGVVGSTPHSRNQFGFALELLLKGRLF